MAEKHSSFMVAFALARAGLVTYFLTSGVYFLLLYVGDPRLFDPNWAYNLIDKILFYHFFDVAGYIVAFCLFWFLSSKKQFHALYALFIGAAIGVSVVLAPHIRGGKQLDGPFRLWIDHPHFDDFLFLEAPLSAFYGLASAAIFLCIKKIIDVATVRRANDVSPLLYLPAALLLLLALGAFAYFAHWRTLRYAF